MISIQQILSEKSYSFKWVDDGVDAFVEIFLPNLSDAKFSIWGDWGPMYYFKISQKDPVRISYGNEPPNSLDLSELPVESPMRAVVREKFPFEIVVDDAKRNISYHLFIDHMGNLKAFQVFELADKRKIFDSEKSNTNEISRGSLDRSKEANLS